MGLTISPPGEDEMPEVDHIDALQEAWRAEGKGGGASKAVATFAHLVGPQFGVHKKMPVWIGTYHDFCVPIEGGENMTLPRCAGNQLNVVIDSSTGAYMFAFSYK